MAPFKLDGIAHRHHAAPLAHTARRLTPRHEHRPPEDARAGELFRGLLYGLPMGLALWLFLAFLLWRVA